jgi:hypothetical protein
MLKRLTYTQVILIAILFFAALFTALYFFDPVFRSGFEEGQQNAQSFFRN